MKLLAMAAFLLLAVTPSGTEAGSLPKPTSLVDRDTAKHVTPYVRGSQAKLADPIRDSSRKSHRDLHQAHYVRGK